MTTKTERKYKSYTELAAAFKSGELDSTKYYLMLDNDSTGLCRLYDDSLSYEENDRLNEEAGEWFSGDGYQDIEAMADALGIPNEWC